MNLKTTEMTRGKDDLLIVDDDGVAGARAKGYRPTGRGWDQDGREVKVPKDKEPPKSGDEDVAKAGADEHGKGGRAKR